MAADTPTIEPLEIRAGDSVSWEKSLSDYPASEWGLTYYLRGPKNLNITATASGQSFAATISAANTATLQPGLYRLLGRVTYGTNSVTVYDAQLTVLPNPADSEQIPEGYDPRSWHRKVRDSLRSAYEGLALHPEVAYTIFGERSVEVPKAELFDQLQKFEEIVRAEEMAERANRGERTGVYIRRLNPR